MITVSFNARNYCNFNLFWYLIVPNSLLTGVLNKFPHTLEDYTMTCFEYVNYPSVVTTNDGSWATSGTGYVNFYNYVNDMHMEAAPYFYAELINYSKSYVTHAATGAGCIGGMPFYDIPLENQKI